MRLLALYNLFLVVFLVHSSSWASGPCDPIASSDTFSDGIAHCNNYIQSGNNLGRVFQCSLEQNKRTIKTNTEERQAASLLAMAFKEMIKVGDRDPAVKSARSMMEQASALRMQVCRVEKRNDLNELLDSFLVFVPDSKVANFSGASFALREFRPSRLVLVSPKDESDGTQESTKLAFEKSNSMAVFSNAFYQANAPRIGGAPGNMVMWKNSLGFALMKEFFKQFPKMLVLHVQKNLNNSVARINGPTDPLDSNDMTRDFADSIVEKTSVQSVKFNFSQSFSIDSFVNTQHYIKLRFPKRRQIKSPGILNRVLTHFMNKPGQAWGRVWAPPEILIHSHVTIDGNTPDSDISLKVEVKNSLGEAIVNEDVRFTIVSGEGDLLEAVVTTDVSGMAETVWTLGPKIGENRVKVELVSNDKVSLEISVLSQSNYPIEMLFSSIVDDRVRAVAQKAAKVWEEVIVGQMPPVYNHNPSNCPGPDGGSWPSEIKGVAIAFNVAENDGPSGSLATGGPCHIRSSRTPFTGIITIDAFDVPRMNDEKLEKVILHEIGHVLGIGPLWGSHIKEGAFIGEKAVGAYTAIGGSLYNGGIRVDRTLSHWSEASLPYEIMSQMYTGGSILSNISAFALEETGLYSKINNRALPSYIPFTSEVSDEDVIFCDGKSSYQVTSP